MSTVVKSNARWWSPRSFTIAVAILATAAVGLNAAVARLQLHFKKLPVPLARELDTVPAHLGNWVQVSKDEPLNREIQDTLGTEHYIFRRYVDTRLVAPARLAEFDGKDSVERDQLAAAIQVEQPEAVMEMDVTYYTGTADTVAHIPDRCYVADGYQPSSHENVTWDLGPSFDGNDGGHTVDAEFINFEDQSSASRAHVTKRVAYFFYADGHYESDPIGVRDKLQNLRYSHGFYSKVELMTTVRDHDRCAAIMTGFLRAAMPAVCGCYPDWAAAERAGR